MKFLHCALVVLVALALTSCASSPSSFSESRAVKQQNIFQDLRSPMGSRKVPVTIIRDAGFNASMTGIIVKLNGDSLAKFYPNERYTFYLEEGTHIFGCYLDLVFERGIIHELEANITSERTNNFRLTIDRGDQGFRIQRTAEF